MDPPKYCSAVRENLSLSPDIISVKSPNFNKNYKILSALIKKNASEKQYAPMFLRPPCWINDIKNSGLDLQKYAHDQKRNLEPSRREFKMADEATNFDEEFYKKLLLEETEKHSNVSLDRVEFVPKPGYVMKLRNKKEEKVFINVCTSEKVPAAKEISDEELVKVLQSVDPTKYRVPMSLGEPRVEVDNRGQGDLLCLYRAVHVVVRWVCMLLL